MTNSYPRLILACLSFLVFISACQKESFEGPTVREDITKAHFESVIYPELAGMQKDFFTPDFVSENKPLLNNTAKNRGLHPLVDAARINLYAQDVAQSNQLMTALIQKVGYPIWDKAFINFDEENAISIPFTKLDDSYTLGVLLGVGNSDLSAFHFQLIDRVYIDQKITDYNLEDEHFNLASSAYSIFNHDYEVFQHLDTSYVNWIYGGEDAGYYNNGDRATGISVCLDCDAPMVFVAENERFIPELAHARELCCAIHIFPCDGSGEPPPSGSCLGCTSTPGPSGGGSSGSSPGMDESTDTRPNPLEDGGNQQQDAGGNQNQDELECFTNTMEYIEENAFTILGMKSYGIALDTDCCGADDFEKCAWGKISEAYGLNFTKEQYDDHVLSFLQENLYGNLDDLINSDVDLNECLASSNPKSCIWEALISPFEEELGDDYEFILDHLPIDGKVITEKIDWSTATDQERVQHVFDKMRLINRIHNCLDVNIEDNFTLKYNFMDQFFTNISGQGATTGWIGGSAAYTKNVPISLKGINGNNITFNVGFVWILFEAQEFKWEIRQANSASAGSNSSDWFGERPSGPTDPLNAVFIFTVPDQYDAEVYNFFRGCPQ